MNKSQKIIAISLGITLLVVAVIGFTYAYFLTGVTGNEQASSLVGITADLGITFTDGSEVKIDNAFPGDYVEKEFNVRNTGSDIVYFDINLKGVYTTIIKDEVVYYLYKKDSNGQYQLFKGETLINNDAALFTRIGLSIGETQYYKIKVQFKELGSAQNYNQGGMFSGTINILSPYTYYTEAPTITLKDRILLDNTSYADNVSSKYVTTNGINFANPSDYGYDGYTTRTETVSITGNRVMGTAYDASRLYSGLFSITGQSSQAISSSSIGKYMCSENFHVCASGIMYKILEVTGSTITKVETYRGKTDTTFWNGTGLYNTSTNTEGNNITHYFRGNVANNYVSFAGNTWRIMRINEDESIRLISSNATSSIAFNTFENDKMYVGFMYGTVEDPYANINNSTVKNFLEDYYDANLESYSSYFSNESGFCNDRYVGSTSGSSVYFAANSRLSTSPILKCLQTNDLFTLTTSSNGNKKLIKPIGLPTADELVYSGIGKVADRTNSYIWMSDIFMTMTPQLYNGTRSQHYYSSYYWPLDYGGLGAKYVRPVINLKSSVLVIGGSGTENDPYRVSLNDTTNKYVSDNSLVLHYDAIDNTPSGHSSSATTWYDLSGNGNNATLNNFGSTSTSGWQSNSLAFDGIDDKGIARSTLTDKYTVSTYVKPIFTGTNPFVISNKFPCIYFQNTEGNNYRIAFYGQDLDRGFPSNTIIDTSLNNLIDITYNGSEVKLYVNGVYKSSVSTTTSPTVGDGYLGGNSVTTHQYTGNIYSVRVYNRALTDSEIKKNYLVDKERFGL